MCRFAMVMAMVLPRKNPPDNVIPMASTVRAMRRAVGLSIRDLESRTGISRAVLSNVERGMAPTPEQAQRIAEALAEAAREGGAAA